MRNIEYYIRQFTLWAFLSWGGWVSVALLFLFDPLSPFINLIGAISVLVSAVFIFKTPLLSLYLLPLPLLIGPILSISVGGGKVTVGDLYSVLFIVGVIFSRPSRFNIGSHPFLMLGSVLIILSAVFSNDLGASLIGVAKIVQFALLVWATNVLLSRPVGDPNICWDNMLSAWVLITTICSVILLWYLYDGQPQFLLFLAANLDSFGIPDINRQDSFYRAAFFYTNFFIPLGFSIIYALVTVMTNTQTGNLKKSLLFISLPVNTVALIANNTRSMLIPIVIFGLLAILWSIHKVLSGSKSNVVMLVMVVLVMVAGLYATSFLLSATQLDAMLEGSADYTSMEMRLSVWGSLMVKFFDSLLRLLFVGWGPQSTTRQEGESILFFLSGSLGNTEGAFDSTPIGLLFEYGAILTTIVFTYVARWFIRLWEYWRVTSNTFILILLLMGLVFVLSHIFQQFTISPPALIAMQVLAFLPVVRETQQAAVDYESL